LIILGSAALVFALAAAVVLWQRAEEGIARYTPVAFLPGFAEKAGGAARIEISGHDGRFAVVLTPNGWVLPEHGNYPANFDEVRQTLITLAQLTTIAPKTNRADWLHYLSLDDPPRGLGNDLVVKDAGGAVLAHLIFGNNEELPAGNAVFVRRPGESQSYLAKAVFPLHGALADWIKTTLFDMGPGRIQELVVTPANGPGYTVGRHFSAENVSVLNPPGAAADPQIVNNLGFAVAAFSFTDVRPSAELDFKGATRVEAHGFDGLAVALLVIQQGEDYWAEVSAGTAPGVPAAISAEAARANARTQGWAFKLPPDKGAVLLTSRQRLLTPPPPDKQGQIMAPGMKPPPQ